MKNISLRTMIMSAAAVVALASTADAQSRRVSAPDYRGGTAQHAISGAFGFYGAGAATLYAKINNSDQTTSPRASGFFGIGGDYDYLYADDLSFGALFRYYSTSDSFETSGGGQVEEKDSAWTLAAMAKYYFPSEHFIPYFGAGLGVVSATVRRSVNGQSSDYDPAATIGFNMSMGILYKINSQMSFGVENLRVLALGEKLNGRPIDDFMFKGRFTF
jgi:outer membrane protein W